MLTVGRTGERATAAVRVGRALDADGVVRGGWTEWVEVPDWPFGATADAGIALADVDGDGRAELLVLAIDASAEAGRAVHRVARGVQPDGAVTGGWGAWQEIPGWAPARTIGGDVAVGDLDGDGRPELIVVMVDGSGERPAGCYAVGRGLDGNGTVSDGWSAWTAIPDWIADEHRGVGATVADLDEDGRPELIVFATQGADGAHHGCYTVGWGLDATGRAADGWGPWTHVTDRSFEDVHRVSAAAAQLADGSRPELMTLMVSGPAARATGIQRSLRLQLDVDRAAAEGVWRLLDFDSQVLAVHAALLRTGDVLFFSGSGNDPDDLTRRRFRTRVWHYPSARFTAPSTPIDLFCAGQAFLAGGRLVAAGGTRQYGPFRGIRDALAFDPPTRRWIRLRSMARERWYPTLITLGDGRVLAVSGRGADGRLDRVPEVFTRGRGWQDLPSHGLLPWYSHLFLLRDGRVFYSGGQMNGNRGAKPTLWDPATGATTTVPGLPRANLRNQAASVLLPPAQAQRVMIIGGGGADLHEHPGEPPERGAPEVATRSSAIVDLSRPSPKYVPTGRLHRGRMHLNATLLPDRTVLATGGASVEERRVDAALHAEIYNPKTRTWTRAARSRVPRLYHSVALLTPDGKVVTAGSNPRPKDDELRIEVYSPPYLFRGPRPEVTLSARSATYGDRLSATTPAPRRLREANLVRAGSTTHAFNGDQRLLDVPFDVTGPTRIELRLPIRRTVAPPGWYMLFVVDRAGVPSVGRWLNLS